MEQITRNHEEPNSMEQITRSHEEAQSKPRDLVNNKLRELVNDKPMDEWDKCWEERVTPWDLGQVTPIVSHLVQQQGLLPQGRVLVPGCGAGYDVIAFASSNRYVIGVDISEKALKQAQELASSAPNAKYCEFVKADFFTWAPVETFDLIFDYTFFCAIEPSMRSAWGKRIAELLKHDGELITLMFPIGDHEGGPPYAVSIPRYEEVLHPLGFEAISIENNEIAVETNEIAFGRRKDTWVKYNTWVVFPDVQGWRMSYQIRNLRLPDARSTLVKQGHFSRNCLVSALNLGQFWISWDFDHILRI